MAARAGILPLCFVNLPNYITLTRIFSIPVLIWVLTSSYFNSTNGERELIASFIFIAASITDAIDGYLARKREQVTTIGMLLDPVYSGKAFAGVLDGMRTGAWQDRDVLFVMTGGTPGLFAYRDAIASDD